LGAVGDASARLDLGEVESLKVEVVCTLFNAFNRAVFDDDHRTRFTLFLPSPAHPDRIVPGVLSVDVQRLLGELRTEESRLHTAQRESEIHSPEVGQLHSTIAVLDTVLESFHISHRR